ncbi:MAG TPA: YihY/virulence factor BrkB family protein [Acidobacteriaceae bacterium]|jgi:membrane protein|nr:YihY/virulence factor BrkB family protein [Acidobacteriaceae bacterium]
MPDDTSEIQQEPSLAAATAKHRIALLPPGSREQWVALGRYLLQTEVHTYAFSVAANSILSLFPFILLLLTMVRAVFHSPQMESVVGDMLRNFLPANAETQDWVVQHMVVLVHPHKKTQIFSLIALLITSTGVFLPLEVALNRIWGVHKDRSYLLNQAVSLFLAFSVGVLAMASVAFTAAQQSFLTWIFFGHTQNIIFAIVTHALLSLFACITSVALFFLIYWVLPHRKIPPCAVLPASVAAGVLWVVGRMIYVAALPWLDFQSVYGPFYISVGLMMWAFLSGLLLLAGAQFSAVRYDTHAQRDA